MKVFSLLCGLGASLVSAKMATIDPAVTNSINTKSSADVFLMFPTYDFDANAAKFNFASGTNNLTKEASKIIRSLRRQFLHDELEQFSSQSQAAAIEYLNSINAEYERFWINNSLYIKNASADVINSLVEVGAESIVLDDIVAEIIQPVAADYFPEDPKENYLWNLQHVNAPQAWEIADGTGITVANIDTGVLYSHVALSSTYRGFKGTNKFEHDFNWGDPQKRSPVPADSNGHGTHTMGTIVGHTKTQHIGVAPGAKWIAARGCASSSCSQYDLTWSGQWVVCPKDIAHGEERCELGADVSSNSWGGGRGNGWYAPVVDAWIAAGIVPVFAQGNSGDRCGTANSPGDMAKVIGVASTNKNNALSRFSSRGPGLSRANFPMQKPDISAPGEAVYSSMNNGNYATLSGTSMACPHVAGLAALILSANPNLTYEQVYAAMTKTANQNLGAPTGQPVCSNQSYDKYPNFHYGYGRIDALKAVKAVSQLETAEITESNAIVA